MKMRKKGFTLIELLVVIAIIALLMSIMMPSLQRVRMSAKRVVCSSNLRQVGTALNLYYQDNEEKIPSDSTSVMKLGGRSGELGRTYPIYAMGAKDRLLNNYCGGPYKTRKEFGRVPYSDYLEADSDVPIFRCPSDKGDPTWSSTSSYKSFGSSYAYNLYWNQSNASYPTLNGLAMNGQSKYIGMRLLSVKTPSRVVFAGDHSMHNFFGGSLGDRKFRWHDRKNATANMVFLDCHVGYFEVEPGHTTENYTFLPTSNWGSQWGW